MRPAADFMPCRTNAAPNAPSPIPWKWVGVGPHSVHQTGTSWPCLASVGRQSSGALPYVCVETKSSGAPDSAMWTSSSSTQPLAAEEGPPTRRSGCTFFTAAAVTS